MCIKMHNLISAAMAENDPIFLTPFLTETHSQQNVSILRLVSLTSLLTRVIKDPLFFTQAHKHLVRGQSSSHF